MKMEICAANVFDTIIGCLDDIETARRNIPRGSYIYEDSPLKKHSDDFRCAEQKIVVASDVLGIPEAVLYAAAHAARRWYKRTNWQRCLSSETADRLLKCMTEQYQRKY